MDWSLMKRRLGQGNALALREINPPSYLVYLRSLSQKGGGGWSRGSRAQKEMGEVAGSGEVWSKGRNIYGKAWTSRGRPKGWGWGDKEVLQTHT